MRITIGKLLAASLLTLCIGLQALEATGRWDQTFQDTGDEAAVVTIVLCVGSALLAANLRRIRFSLSTRRSPFVFLRPSPLPWPPSVTLSASCAGPPRSLRI